MDATDLASRIDQTMLRPDATVREIEAFAAESLPYGFAALCVPPCHVPKVADVLSGSGTKIAAVAGFPLGFHETAVKLLEAETAFDAGATEIDLVINISRLKSGDIKAVEREISAVVRSLPGAAVKAIIETCYLTDAEKFAALEAAVSAGAHFIKTSTGFGPAGAKAEDVALLFQKAAGRIKVKASGGIKTLQDALTMLDAGASRLGTSSGIMIIESLKAV